MWPFGKKKLGKEQLNRLSETEIQSKLYGHFDSIPEKSLTPKAPEVKPTKSVSVQAISNSPNDLFPPTTKLENLEAISGRSAEVDIDEESITHDSREDSIYEPYQKSVESEGSPEEESQDESSFQSEEEVITQKQYVETMIPPKWENKKQKSEIKAGKKVLKQNHQVGLKVKRFFEKLGRILLGALVYAVRLPQAFFYWVYHNRKAAKKVALWGIGLAIVIFLFLSVHYLNVNREEAMTGKSRYSQSARETLITEATDKNVVPKTPSLPVEASDSSSNETKYSERNISSSAVTTEEGNSRSTATDEDASSTADTSADSPGETDDASTQTTVQNNGEYVVQVATYAFETDADRMAKQMVENGWPAFVQGLSRAGGRIYYSVFLGRFESYSSSQKTFEKFKKADIAKPFSDAFIRKLRQKNQ